MRVIKAFRSDRHSKPRQRRERGCFIIDRRHLIWDLEIALYGGSSSKGVFLFQQQSGGTQTR